MKAKVFFVPLAENATIDEQCAAMRKIIPASGAAQVLAKGDLTGVKIHVGEKNNVTYIKPAVIREVVDFAKNCEAMPFLTETSTLYRGERDNAIKHITLANEHGFTFDAVGAPFICADGLLGNSEVEVEIDGVINKSVKVARDAVSADSLLIVSHPTGHMMAGIGAAIKNLGMGLASRQGKMRQHSDVKPVIIEESCKKCGRCVKWCPKDAIVMLESGARIDSVTCIGCGECLAVCKFNAIKHSWEVDTDLMQQNMAEHAYGAVKDKIGKVFYFNVLVNMTKECDCMGEAQHKCMRDIGIMASSDPVALDQATLDITAKFAGKNLAQLSHETLNYKAQLIHAEKIGMGSIEYELVEV
ncbi:MAG: DUF362 domain-containing protein [Negativicutes bacterium]|jgi:hypothetical protein